MTAPRHIVIMGVSGTGKTTIGRALVERLQNAVLVEGDDFHPRANIEKMTAGIPLDDDDRRPWLQALAREIARLGEEDRTSVVACSALRRIYRDWLREGDPDLFFVHLHTGFEVLLERMEQREHFMPTSLLQSQFDTLEMLQEDERGAVIDDSPSIEGVLANTVEVLSAAGMTITADRV